MSALRQLWAALIVLVFASAPMAMLGPSEGLEEPSSEDDGAPHVVHRRVAKAQTVRPRRSDDEPEIDSRVGAATMPQDISIAGTPFEQSKPVRSGSPVGRASCVWPGQSARGPPRVV